MAVRSLPSLSGGLQLRSARETLPARPGTSRRGQLRSRAARRVAAWVPPAVAQRPPQPLAPPSPGSAAPHARGRPAELARLTYAVAARGLPAPCSAPSLGSRHPPRAGVDWDSTGRGVAPPHPEPPGATGRGGPTGESLTRGSGPRCPLGDAARILLPVARSRANASRSLNVLEQ